MITVYKHYMVMTTYKLLSGVWMINVHGSYLDDVARAVTMGSRTPYIKLNGFLRVVMK